MAFDVLAREKNRRAGGFNRWLIPPVALAIHLCIGQVYATSVYKSSLVDGFGASLTSIGIVFSLAIVMLGLSAAVFGTGSTTAVPPSDGRPRPCAGRPGSSSAPPASPPASCGCSTSATA